MELFFDDFSLGDEMISSRRTITEADVVNFTGLSGDFNALHIDEEFAKETPYKTRVAHGLLSVSVVTGLQSMMGNINSSTLGLLEINWKFKKGVIPGDTIYAKFVVKDKKETSKNDRGVLIRSVYVYNQHQQIVSEGEIILLMKRKTPTTTL
ncbi:MaoC/PaaZ C-terminal domain-containing protein [Alkalihalobacterium elongatum]|uniref:MaoC/PaaZ C-terminal domain-containing protein n=1 Tax=Alkalihalobacterium elongatum TaxID=2675466 RepID=UPI001C1FEA06|nr:MaoC/PaaZ C-terminal domain-containing protein [Alkalihalobacterium elongatum]